MFCKQIFIITNITLKNGAIKHPLDQKEQRIRFNYFDLYSHGIAGCNWKLHFNAE